MTDDLIGRRFAKLLVISRAESYKWTSQKTKKTVAKARYNCLCDCGRQVIVRANSLKRELVIHCQSCAYASRKQSTRRLSALERLFRLRIKRNAEHRGIPVEITAEDFLNIGKNNCTYCNKEAPMIEVYKNKFSKSEIIKINGLDRIDSTKGYTKENLVSCCTQCNTAKLDKTFDDFKQWVGRVYKNIYKNEPSEEDDGAGN